MTKDAYYFSHDANARHDPKCLKLQAKFGMEGYGIFWAVVETLREHHEYKIPLSDIDAIDMDCKCNAKAVIDYCISIGLFESDSICFYAPSLMIRMKHLDGVRIKRKKAADKRWSKSKETKVKESKVKESSLHSKSNASAMQKHIDLTPFGIRIKQAFSVCKHFPIPKDRDLVKIQDGWEKLYGRKDIEREIVKADTWLASKNEKRSKLTFISNWLEKSTDLPPAPKIKDKYDDMDADEIAGIGHRRHNKETDKWECLINGEWKNEKEEK